MIASLLWKRENFLPKEKKPNKPWPTIILQNNILYKGLLLRKLKGAQCSEPVKSRVPIIYNLYEESEIL